MSTVVRGGRGAAGNERPFALAVFCGSSMGNDPGLAMAAREVGAEIARRRWTLVYGGGRVGLMGVLADAALAGGARAIGVIPKFLYTREIAHNRLTDLGGGGVKVGHESQRTMVADNEIAHAGRMFMSAVGIWVGHSAGNQIVHNHIQDLHYSGISVGWQWDFKPSKAVSNIVKFNHIHDLGHRLLSDMGGIYTLGVSPGTRLRYNVIHDVQARAYGGWGIYPDEGSSEILIENNLVYRCSSSPYFSHINRNITVQINIFALGQQCQIERAGAAPGPELEYAFRRNIVYYDRGQLVGYWDPRNRNFAFERNLYWNAAGASITFSGQSLAEWQASGHDKDSIIADPGFMAPEKGDFRLRQGSSAAKIGFEPWDLTAVGPRPDRAASK
jgi:hypothetical protein